jgi:hypothetical protein
MSATQAAIEAFAKHSVGYCRYSGGSIPTTFVFSDEACTRPLGWQHGLLEDGAVWFGAFNEVHRLTLVGAERALAEAA